MQVHRSGVVLTLQINVIPTAGVNDFNKLRLEDNKACRVYKLGQRCDFRHVVSIETTLSVRSTGPILTA